MLPGDPGRALRLAQLLTDGPKMLNHNRGLWGYTGIAADGLPLTVQSSGMGGPSAAIVVHELIALGARRIVRAGTCGALAESLRLGDLLVAERVLGEDGTSRALGAPGAQTPDPVLTAALLRAPGAGARGVAVVTRDLFYDERGGWPAGAAAVEMEAATVLAVCTGAGAVAACVLAVSDVLSPDGGRERIGEAALLEAEERLGHAAYAALSA